MLCSKLQDGNTTRLSFSISHLKVHHHRIMATTSSTYHGPVQSTNSRYYIFTMQLKLSTTDVNIIMNMYLQPQVSWGI